MNADLVETQERARSKSRTLKTSKDVSIETSQINLNRSDVQPNTPVNNSSRDSVLSESQEFSSSNIQSPSISTSDLTQQRPSSLVSLNQNAISNESKSNVILNDHSRRKLQSLQSLVDVADKYGQTPLHVAAFHRNVDAVILLMKSKAGPNILDLDAKTALDAEAAMRNLILEKLITEPMWMEERTQAIKDKKVRQQYRVNACMICKEAFGLVQRRVSCFEKE